jgi:hypothetical protein
MQTYKIISYKLEIDESKTFSFAYAPFSFFCRTQLLTKIDILKGAYVVFHKG